jgi:hypothetical protein
MRRTYGNRLSKTIINYEPRGRISLWIILRSQYLQKRVCYLLHSGFMLGLLFDPEAGGDMFLRNIC